MQFWVPRCYLQLLQNGGSLFHLPILFLYCCKCLCQASTFDFHVDLRAEGRVSTLEFSKEECKLWDCNSTRKYTWCCHHTTISFVVYPSTALALSTIYNDEIQGISDINLAQINLKNNVYTDLWLFRVHIPLCLLRKYCIFCLLEYIETDGKLHFNG